MAKGTVKFFNLAKGFGFISPHDGGADVFVHFRRRALGLVRSLEKGDEMSFELEKDRRSGKLAAVDLHVNGSAPSDGRSSHPPARSRGFGRETVAIRRGAVAPAAVRGPGS
jgi:CspA family cold shock protein